MLRSFQFPENLESKIFEELKKLKCDPVQHSQIAAEILRLSDHFIAGKSKSPFSERAAQVAYLAYYFPLNYLRAKAVCEEATRIGFFEGLNTAVDFGSGLGSLALNLANRAEWRRILSVDISGEALKLQEKLTDRDFNYIKTLKKENFVWDQPTDLAAFSYSWNELTQEERAGFLKNLENVEAIMIIEPSTQTQARVLMNLRQALLGRGFHAWAPCTHQAACPLLAESKTDWCHDRIAAKKSDWMNAIEKHLPFKNETLTFSYLLMRKTPRVIAKPDGFSEARVIGDELVEKGKTKQAICRSSAREFLAWFPQRLQHNIFSYIHGEMILIADQTPKKNNEIRLNENDVIKTK